MTYRARNGATSDTYRQVYGLLNIKQPQQAIPLLPILPTSPSNTLALLTASTPSEASAGSSSFAYPDLELSAQLQRLEGPWSLFFNMPIPPKNASGLHFTFDRPPRDGNPSVVEVQHELIVEIVVSTASAAVSSSASHGEPQTGPDVPHGAEKGRDLGETTPSGPPVSNADYETIEISIPVELLSVSFYLTQFFLDTRKNSILFLALSSLDWETLYSYSL